MFELLHPAAIAFISTVDKETERIPTDGYYNNIRHGGKEHLPLSNTTGCKNSIYQRLA